MKRRSAEEVLAKSKLAAEEEAARILKEAQNRAAEILKSTEVAIAPLAELRAKQPSPAPASPPPPPQVDPECKYSLLASGCYHFSQLTSAGAQREIARPSTLVPRMWANEREAILEDARLSLGEGDASRHATMTSVVKSIDQKVPRRDPLSRPLPPLSGLSIPLCHPCCPGCDRVEGRGDWVEGAKYFGV